MTEREPMGRAQATAAVHEALRCSVALVTAGVEQVDVAPSLLLEGSDPELVCRLLANMVKTMFEITMPDSGRALLVRIGRIAAEDDGE